MTTRSVWWAAAVGAAQGAAECALLFATSGRYTLAEDWFLAVMLVFATTTGSAVAARYRLSLLGVAVAGLAGMMVGGWVGVRTVGDYEYTVPTPPEEREIRVTGPKGRQRVIPLDLVPERTVKRVPVGGGIGVLLGWAAGAAVYARLARRPDAGDAAGQGA